MGTASRGADAAAAAVDVGLRPVTDLAGVGPGVAEKLAKLGITRLQDLWFHLPRAYEDRTRILPIARLRPGETAQVEGCIEAVERGFRYRPVLRVAISDDSRATLVLRFFHFRAAQVQRLQVGQWLRCYGEVRHGSQGLEIVHPAYALIAPEDRGATSDRLTPIYPAVEGLGGANLRRLVERALQRIPPDAMPDLLPPGLRHELGLPQLREALAFVHSPPPGTPVEALLAGVHPAQQRLAFEELLAHHLSLRRRRIAVRRQSAPRLTGGADLVGALREALPFRLTGAQERVFAQIRNDLASREPMLRLVQGDVGSGKTVVAALAMLCAVGSGQQAALMAPTELLAEQHAANLRAWLAPLGIEPAFLAGKVTGKARQRVLGRIASGEVAVAVGTHALMQEAVAFARLGLVVVDEQHRFGVHQRLALRDKGASGELVPHQLVMTATPIPRTLAMTAYADLDASAIDELPPGRTPVRTVVLSAERREEVIERIQAGCAQGRQAYWVCTLIEDSEEVQAQAAQSTFERLCAQLAGLRVGLVHGRLKPKEKQAVMQDFKSGALDLLVATTVIEVGVDVPNASLMVIENAERLGLAQLHQLRGRVGRGAEASSCVLLYQPPLSQLARQRLETMRATNDGFEIAEKDLELRGPGELLGTRQTGLAGFRIADLGRDAHLLPAVHAAADAVQTRGESAVAALIARWVGAAERYAGA
jgi:ATP-dependent DNA helicase RecG